MDLLSKSILAVVLLAVLVFAAYYISKSVHFGKQISEQQAESLVLNDLRNQNPDSVINITNTTPSQFAGSWHIIASVVLNATTPCPSYNIYSFDYPEYGFVYKVDNTYTENCVIYGNITNYGINSWPVAITDSYIQNVSSVRNFIDSHGFQDVQAHATYYPSIYLYGANYSGVWLVNYTSSNSHVNVYLSQANGSAIQQNVTVSKSANSTITTKAETINSNGLALILDLKNATISSGSHEGVSLSLLNTLNKEVTILSAKQSLNLGPCTKTPVNLSVYSGYYTLKNLTGSQELNIFFPVGVTYECAAEFPVNSYQFYADSTSALVNMSTSYYNQSTNKTYITNRTEVQSMVFTENLNGSWGVKTGYSGNAIISIAANFTDFTPGQYTVVAGDEWGDMAVAYFNVTR